MSLLSKPRVRVSMARRIETLDAIWRGRRNILPNSQGHRNSPTKNPILAAPATKSTWVLYVGADGAVSTRRV